MTKEQFIKITNWQKETFGQSTSLSKLAHLKQELKELKSDVKNNAKGKRHEFADCLFLLFGAAHAEGMTYEDICDSLDEKLEINKNRVWGKPDENGVVNHIK